MAGQMSGVRTLALILIPIAMTLAMLVGTGGSMAVGVLTQDSDPLSFLDRLPGSSRRQAKVPRTIDKQASEIPNNAGHDITSSIQSESQGDWFFGFFGELHFDTGMALPGNAALTNHTIFTSEASITQSDASGNLLFYSDGRTIWNNLHAPVSSGLNGGTHPTQALSVPDPADPNPGNPKSFYLISMRGYVPFPTTTDGNFGYTKVSVSGSNVTLSLLNTPIPPPGGADNRIAEMVTAVPGCGSDYWIIVHGSFLDPNTAFRHALFVYPLTASGIETPAVYPIVGPALFGQLKASPDGTRIAYGTGDERSMVGSNPGFSRVLDFNRNSGVLSNPRVINRYGYGVSFSPNSQLLYLTDSVSSLQNIFQYDLSTADLNDSETLVAELTETYSALQLGPDNRIYVALNGNNHLAVINFPDERNTGSPPNACGYSFDGPFLNIPSSGTSVTSGFGLPNMIDAQRALSIPADFSFKVSSCGTIHFEAPACASSYAWDFGDSQTSNAQNPTHTYAADGTYSVKLILNGSTVVSRDVTIGLEASSANIIGPAQVCLLTGNPALYNYAAMDQQGLTYNWTATGGVISGTSNSNSVDVVWNSLPGAVHLTLTNPATGCSITRTLSVTHNCGQLAGGPLVISRFRENGPAGAGDEFVEIFNAGNSAHAVVSDNGSGYGVFATAGNGTASNTVSLVCRIPDGTVIPSRGYFLCVGSSYSLGDLGRNGGVAGATAIGDAAMIDDIPNDAGLALINVSSSSSSAFSVFDRVGFAPYGAAAPAPTLPSIAPFFCEGTCLQPVGDASVSSSCTETLGFFPVTAAASACYGQSGQYEFLRRQTAFDPSVGTLHRDTGNNADDFILVSPNAATNLGQSITGISGITSVLGAAGPHNSSAPRDTPFISLTQAPFDVGSQLGPRNAQRNYGFDPSITNSANNPQGTFSLRFRFTNNSGNNIMGLRFRLDNASTLCGPLTATPTVGTGNARNLSSSDCGTGSFTAILKLLNSAKEVVVDGSGTAWFVHGTVLEDLSATLSSPAQSGTGPLSPLGGGVDNSIIVGHTDSDGIIGHADNAGFVGDGVTGGVGSFATTMGTSGPTQVLRVNVKFGVVRSGRFILLITAMAKTSPTP